MGNYRAIESIPLATIVDRSAKKKTTLVEDVVLASCQGSSKSLQWM